MDSYNSQLTYSNPPEVGNFYYSLPEAESKTENYKGEKERLLTLLGKKALDEKNKTEITPMKKYRAVSWACALASLTVSISLLMKKPFNDTLLFKNAPCDEDSMCELLANTITLNGMCNFAAHSLTLALIINGWISSFFVGDLASKKEREEMQVKIKSSPMTSILETYNYDDIVGYDMLSKLLPQSYEMKNKIKFYARFNDLKNAYLRIRSEAARDSQSIESTFQATGGRLQQELNVESLFDSDSDFASALSSALVETCFPTDQEKLLHKWQKWRRDQLNLVQEKLKEAESNLNSAFARLVKSASFG